MKRILQWHCWLIRVIGVIVPRRLRADWRQEWEAELRHRERLLTRWDRLDWRRKIDLLRRSLSAFWDALLLQPRRLEDQMFQDLRFGVRMLRKSPAFTLMTIVSLAIGIGANTAIFSLANAVLWHTPPFARPEQVMTFTPAARNRDFFYVSYPAYKDLRDHNQVLGSLSCWTEVPLSLSLGEQSVQAVAGMLVSGNYFSMLGVQPALGRFFAPEEDQTPGTHPVTVISYRMWQRRFGGDAGIIGRMIKFNGHPFTIIGVTPQGFTSTLPLFAPEAWVPMMMQPQILPQSKELLTSRSGGGLYLTGRLKAGISVEEAEANLSTIALQLEAETPPPSVGNQPEERRNSGVKLIPGGSFPPRIRKVLIGFLSLLLAVVGLVLLIACANLTSLLLARATARRKEIATRLALGASRLRIVRQLLAESVMLCLMSGAAGLLLAVWINRLLLKFKPALDLPFVLDLKLDLRVLGASITLSFITGALFGLVPAWQASGPDVIGALKDDARSPGHRVSRLRYAFVIGQIAMSLLLLVCAGLFWRALSEGQKFYQGFEPERVQTVTFDPRFVGYDEKRSHEFYRRLLERMRALPGVEAASVAVAIPVGGDSRMRPLAVGGKGAARPEDLPLVDQNVVSPGFLATMKIRLLRGRDFTEDDAHRAPVAIIDEVAAREWFGDGDPLGQRLTNGATEFEIIGVAERGNQRIPGVAARPYAYLPYALYIGDGFSTNMILHVRTQVAGPEVYAAIRREVGQLDRQVTALFMMSLAEYVRLGLLPQRIVASLAGVLGLLGLAIAAIGIFGVVSYAVSQRTHEIGIRMALGAQSGDVLALILRQGVKITLLGISIGLLASWATTRLLTKLLYGVSATDPLTFAGVSVLLAGVALLACFLPARRATRVDPLVALRHE